MSDRRNIVFIFTDQQRADTMGYAGDPVAITPNTDRLAAEGVVFRRCCATSPVCMATRASLLSGKHVNDHGVWAMADPALRHGPSHVRNIRDAGYRTAVVGKTHLWLHGKGHTRDHVDEMHDYGYTDPHEMTGPSESASTDSPYTDHLAEKGLLDTHREYLRTYLRGQAQGVSLPWELPPSLLPTEDHLDMFIARKAEEWIGGYGDDQPFYLQVCFGGPHDPWDSPAEYRKMYNADEMPLSITEQPTGPLSPHVEMLLKYAPAKLDGMSEAQNRVMKTYYYGKVGLIDDCIGRVLKALEGRGLMENTWIVFSSDHGEMLGDHGLIAKKVFYEGALNIPCIVRPPGGIEGWQSDGLTDHLDIGATMLDAADAAPYEDSDGRSLLPLIAAGPDSPESQVHKEAVLSEMGLPPMAYSMVRTDRYKMSVNTLTREPLDLYDMEEDPNELHNRVADPALQDVRDALLNGHLDRLLSRADRSKLQDNAKTRWQRK
ncbi:MAG: sulfatase-like hydrolase/transferase [Desulfobacterales bacterium]